MSVLPLAREIPEPPPREPFGVLARWMEGAAACGVYKDPWAMTLATATREGRPSARVVLCKGVDAARGTLTFFTNYESRKGRELGENPYAAAVFHWPHAGWQARVEGAVERVSSAESDAYFETRPLLSRVGAVVSPQSREIASRGALLAKVGALAGLAAAGRRVERPSHWGGYRIVAEEVELWAAAEGRLHQRVQWRREGAGAWGVRLLGP